MITYKWSFPAFDCRVDKNEMKDVVTVVHWIYDGTDEDGITVGIYGTQSVGEPNPDAFTPYPDISEEQVIGWMESVMNVEEMNINIETQIKLIKNPITVTLPPPFKNN